MGIDKPTGHEDEAYENALMYYEDTEVLPGPNRSIFPRPTGYPSFRVYDVTGRSMQHDFAIEEDARTYIRLLRTQGKFKGTIQLYRDDQPDDPRDLPRIVKLDVWEIK